MWLEISNVKLVPRDLQKSSPHLLLPSNYLAASQTLKHFLWLAAAIPLGFVIYLFILSFSLIYSNSNKKMY